MVLPGRAFVMTVCFTLREIVASILGNDDKVVVIPNGFDSELFKTHEHRGGTQSRRA